jgi:uncharacterized membrane protein (UPF0127 family)
MIDAWILTLFSAIYPKKKKHFLMKFLSLALDMFYAEHEQDLRDATKSITNLLNLLPSPQPTIKPLHHFAVKNKF